MGRDRERDRDRRERLEQVRREQRRAERRSAAIIWGTAVAVVVAITGAVVFAVVRDRANRPSLAGVQTSSPNAGHVTTPVTYAQTPPAGGEHAPIWVNCGTYDRPITNENAVHAMEHGAVWITYQPDLPAADVKKLRALTPSTYAILSPYTGLPAPVVVSSWGKQLRLTGASDKRLPAFIRAYRQGPGTPELGAACTGGIDGAQTSPPSTATTMPAPDTSSGS